MAELTVNLQAIVAVMLQLRSWRCKVACKLIHGVVDYEEGGACKHSYKR